MVAYDRRYHRTGAIRALKFESLEPRLPLTAELAWQPFGPTGGDVLDIEFSPLDSNVVLVGVAPGLVNAGGSLFRSTDGGNTWFEAAEFRPHRSVYDIEFAPDGTVYVASFDSIWKSQDNGTTWQQLDLGLGINDKVLEIAVDPNNPSNVWASSPSGPISIPGEPDPVDARLLLSTDGGETWNSVAPVAPGSSTASAIAFDPNDNDTVYLALGDGWGVNGQFWVTEDYGQTWIDRSAGLPGEIVNDIVHDGNRLLVAGGTEFTPDPFGVFESTDRGLTWNALHDASWPSLSINDIEIAPNNSSAILLGTTDHGVFSSSDGGTSWSFTASGTESKTVRVGRFQPGNPSRILVGADSFAVLASSDSGGSFGASSTGIHKLNVTSIASNPMQRDEIAVSFASLNNGGLYTSIDAGATWQLEPVEHARWKVVDFSANGTLFAAANGPAGLPNGLSRRNADGSWTLIGPEAGSDFESIFLDPDDPNHILAGGQASFADGSDAMIMRTTDGGATWTQVYDSGTNSLVGDIEMVGSVLLAIDVALSQNDGDILRSLDNGVTWTPVSVGFGTYPRRFHAVPDAPQTVLLADASYFLNAQNGLKKSTDAGQTWTLIGPPDRVGDVVVDPRNNQAVFALLWGDDNIVQRSLDGGSTFSQFSVGLGGLSGSKLTFVDGVTPHLLMAGAYNGIYKIDAKVLGDFNYDRAVDATDIDALYAEVNAGTHNTFFDLTGDDHVTAADVDVLVRDILGTEYGDANLDKGVSLLDLDILGQNYDQASGWAGGDFTGNGMVSLVDLDVLGQHYGAGTNSPTFSVPLAVDTPHWQTKSSASRSAAVARVRNWVSERESEFEDPFVSAIDDPPAYGVAPFDSPTRHGP